MTMTRTWTLLNETKNLNHHVNYIFFPFPPPQQHVHDIGLSWEWKMRREFWDFRSVVLYVKHVESVEEPNKRKKGDKLFPSSLPSSSCNVKCVFFMLRYKNLCDVLCLLEKYYQPENSSSFSILHKIFSFSRAHLTLMIEDGEKKVKNFLMRFFFISSTEWNLWSKLEMGKNKESEVISQKNYRFSLSLPFPILSLFPFFFASNIRYIRYSLELAPIDIARVSHTPEIFFFFDA